MKKYFKVKIVEAEFTTLGFVSDPLLQDSDPRHYMLDRSGDYELHVVECDDDDQAARILAMQYPSARLRRRPLPT